MSTHYCMCHCCLIFMLCILYSHAPVQDVSILIPPLNNETKALLIFKWCYLLQRLLTFIAIWMFLWEIPGCRPCLQALSPEAAQRLSFYLDTPLISFSLSFCLTPHWLILFWLAWAGMHLPSNALLCSSKLTMKSAIILQHKYFIPHLDADSRCHTQNTNGLSLPRKITAGLCEYDLCEL